MNTRAISTSVAHFGLRCLRPHAAARRARRDLRGRRQPPLGLRAVHLAGGAHGLGARGDDPRLWPGHDVDRRRSLLGRLRSRAPAVRARRGGAAARLRGRASRSRHRPRRRAVPSRRRVGRPDASRSSASRATSAPSRPASSTRSPRRSTCSTAPSTRARWPGSPARSACPRSRCCRPADRPSAVNIVVAWELCWYRYEVDLSDEVPRSGSPGRATSSTSSRPRSATATRPPTTAVALSL